MASNVTCAIDFDCAVDELCYANVSWDAASASAGRCYCNTWFGWVRDPQDGSCALLSAPFVFTVVDSSLLVLVLLRYLWMPVCDLYLAARAGVRMSASVGTHVQCLLAGVAFLAWVVSYMVETVSPSIQTIGYAAEEYKIRHSTVSTLTASFLATTQFMVLLATLSVSMIWVETADAVKGFSASPSASPKFVLRYRVSVVTVEVIFLAIVVVGAVTNNMIFTTGATGPFMLLTALFYLFGSHRLLEPLREALRFIQSEEGSKGGVTDASLRPLPGSDVGSAESSASQRPTAQRLQHVIASISRCAIQVVVCLLVLLSALVGWTVIFQTGSGWAEYAPPGRFGVLNVLLTVIVWTMVLIWRAVLVFTHRQTVATTKNIYRTRAQTSTAKLTPVTMMHTTRLSTRA
jgi:hypothetical protein